MHALAGQEAWACSFGLGSAALIIYLFAEQNSAALIIYLFAE